MAPWKQSTLSLFSDQPKYQATALFLLRTEVICLNAWLASIHVPRIGPECGSGWLCTASQEQSCSIGLDAKKKGKCWQSRRVHKQWPAGFVQQGILNHLNTAREIEEEEAENHTPFQPLDEVE